MKNKSIHALISGRVQGVWYRGWAAQEAARLELRGWVQNRSDGHVEAVFCGSEDDVDAMLGLCWQGPRMASVQDIITTPADIIDETGFRVRR